MDGKAGIFSGAVRICRIRIGTGGTLRLALLCHASDRVRKDLSVLFLLWGKHEDKADDEQYPEKEQEQRVDKAAQFENKDFRAGIHFLAPRKIRFAILYVGSAEGRTGSISGCEA